MPVIQLPMPSRPVVADPAAGPGVATQALRLVAEIWRARLSGTLLVPRFEGRPPRTLPFVDGALADRLAFMYLNAALHREGLRFEESPLRGRSDRAALIRLLMDRARTLARNGQDAALPECISLTIDTSALAALGLSPAVVDSLTPFASASLPCMLLTRARGDAELARDLRCLLLLGFACPAASAPAPRAPCRGDSPVTGEIARALGQLRFLEPTLSLAPEESFSDPASVLLGAAVDLRALEHRVEAREDEEIDDLLGQARGHMRRGEWALAHPLLVAAHARRFDHARVLAHLAVVTLFAPSTANADAAGRARQLIDLAIVLDDSDPVVRRLARAVERSETEGPAALARGDWLEQSEGLCLTIL